MRSWKVGNRFKVVLVLVAACSILAPVSARGRGQGAGGELKDPEQRVRDRIERLSRDLSLSDEQREQVEPILLDAARQMGDLRRERGQRSGDEDRIALRDSIRKINDETNARLSTVLDEEQMRELRRLQERHRKETRGSRAMPTRARD